MALIRRFPKTERWSQLMHDLTLVGPANQPLGFTEEFARQWVNVAMAMLRDDAPDWYTVVRLYYGLGGRPPLTRAEIGDRINRSIKTIGLYRQNGTDFLGANLARLWHLKVSTPPHEGSLGLFLTEVFSEDCVIRTTTRSWSAEGGALVLARRMSRRLTKGLALHLTEKLGRPAQLSDLASLPAQQVRQMAGLGPDPLRWLEDYLYLFGVVLPGTETVYGMRPEVRSVLASMNVL